ncbi:hypothetical protein ADL28_02500 [Streptomyces violaceusniger]|uniref:Uncharacterized protein n=2 Tax=Streptomyces TaxID=1883 RepID=A0A0X3XD30_STRVO|nr:hypothetical protein ADL28_02500 [Streptomyces violaceusniger]
MNECRVESMPVLVLLGVLALVIGGCACVVWAERGGPRWARSVATVTPPAGELLRRSGRASANSSPADAYADAMDDEFNQRFPWFVDHWGGPNTPGCRPCTSPGASGRWGSASPSRTLRFSP